MTKVKRINLEELQKELEEKLKKREKKKKPKMKISGKSVFELQKIIQKKAKSSKRN